ncbi:hypothetical protein DICPUDRAFT_159011 [Dictyostelium purpureum]|uniref:Uncharacterized protein n=1 Tax=Dictyostelium purpureum TaxID=5786 RepID=F1A319_DICPU|nr:uncharacterized protein DICPUDRAFT_159011 [Dictyostelium purpureum]EGC29408.1 hypothetical protein DICPUDRAFT_159011 [Dictyostelium purpureum]|eukprot:XP_003294062.1 hypothetical protein DICPUDRAFT_159011 [Dictyostelium purpureum]
MEVEIDRLLKATPNNITPIIFSMVKSQFSDDLFPNSISTKPYLSSKEWLSGENNVPISMSLNQIDNQVQDFDDLSVSSP